MEARRSRARERVEASREPPGRSPPAYAGGYGGYHKPLNLIFPSLPGMISHSR
jgi:hypothetical protein